MKTIFVCGLVSFLVLLHGCGGDKPTGDFSKQPD